MDNLAAIGRRIVAVLSGGGMRLPVFVAAVIAGWHIAGVVYAADNHPIVQKNRSFNFKRITIAVGDTVQFGNHDEFIHQVFVESSSFNFDTAESSPGDTINIKFSVPGNFEVHCHIHPKMQLLVNVN
ncbi:MAG TPA: plastocyanin/azurin family copper-binding protein [Alphaproteobacteria bacterium]